MTDVVVLCLVCVVAVIVAAIRSVDLQHARQELQHERDHARQGLQRQLDRAREELQHEREELRLERERNDLLAASLQMAREHRERLYTVLAQVNLWPAGPTRLEGWEGIPGQRREMDRALEDAARHLEER